MSTYVVDKLVMDYVGALDTQLDPTDLSLHLASPPGSGVPTDGPYRARVSPAEEDGTEEWIMVDVGKSGSTLSWSSTSMRGIEDSTGGSRGAQTWPIGSKVEIVLTGEALRRAFIEAPGSPTHDFSFQLWGDELMWINNRTRESAIADPGKNADFLDDWLEMVARSGPSGTGGLGTPGASASFINMNFDDSDPDDILLDNRQCLLEHPVGIPRNGTGNATASSSPTHLTIVTGTLTSDDADRWIVVLKGKSGDKDLLTRIVSVSGSTVVLADPVTQDVSGGIWLLPKWGGVKFDGAGLGNHGQGNGKPDAGGFVFAADPAAYGVGFTRGDQQGVFDWRNMGFGAYNLTFGFITWDGNNTADYGRVGFGNGTGNAVTLISCKAIGGNFSSWGVGQWQDSFFGDGLASADEYCVNCFAGNPGDANVGVWAQGTVTTSTGTDFRASGSPFVPDMVGKIIVIYGGTTSNRPFVTKVAGYTNAGQITLEDPVSRSVTGANSRFFVVGGLGMFIGVGDIMLSGINIPSGSTFSLVVAAGGTVTLSLPFHVGGSNGSPDALVLAAGQADLTAYWDNIEHGDFFTGGAAKTGGVHVLPATATAVGVLNISGRFNHNDALTPSVFLDGGTSGTSTTSTTYAKGPVRISRAFTNGDTGNIPSILRFGFGWPTGKGVTIGPAVDFIRTALAYDDDGSTGSTGAKPNFITDDVLVSADSGSAASAGYRTAHGTATFVNATATFAHGLSKTPDHVLFSPGTPAGQVAVIGPVTWAADATSVTFTSSAAANGDNGKKLSVTARVVGA